MAVAGRTREQGVHPLGAIAMLAMVILGRQRPAGSLRVHPLLPRLPLLRIRTAGPA